MKPQITYVLLFVYAATICKPLTIWFADVLEHNFNQKQHLKILHSHNGGQHVHYQIMEAGKQDAPQEKNSTVKTGNDFSPALLTGHTVAFDQLIASNFLFASLKRFPQELSPLSFHLPGMPQFHSVDIIRRF